MSFRSSRQEALTTATFGTPGAVTFEFTLPGVWLSAFGLPESVCDRHDTV